MFYTITYAIAFGVLNLVGPEKVFCSNAQIISANFILQVFHPLT